MQESTRAFFKRGGTACAAAALVLGSTFTAVPMASAAPAESPAPTATVTTAPAPSEGALPGGLEEALERDLDMTKAEFDEAGQLAQKALDAEAAVEAAGVDAQVSVKDGTINVHTAAPDAKVTGEKLSKELGVSVEVSVKSNDVQRKYAPSVDALAADYLAAASDEDLAELQAIGWNGNEFVIHTGAVSTEKSARQRRNADVSSTLSVTDFASRYANVSIKEAEGPAEASAEEVVAGQGYGHEMGNGSIALCSIGWNGFSATGDPAVISAGHCTNDGAYDDVVLTDPEADQADPGFADLGAELGTFGFSQFGGPNNSPVTGYEGAGSLDDMGNFGTDVSVIDNINPELELLPKVTDWTNVANIAANGRKVTGVSTAVLGADICKSGRTTGWTCGKVDEITLFLVGGTNIDTDVDDIRGVKGFASYGALNAQGDSGGAVISGTLAVGITSAASRDGTVAYNADLKEALARTNGYTVELAVNAPALGSPQDKGSVITGSAVSGTVPGDLAPASSVVVTIDGTATSVPVKDGEWSFNAPSTPGKFTFTVQSQNGFSTSATKTYTLTAILAAPAISTPKDGARMTSFVESISGSGIPGATVVLTEDVTGEVKVAKDGTWTYKPDEALRYGQYTVKAVQRLGGVSSNATSSSFKVVPAKPVITSPSDGQVFSYEEGGPETIDGTGIDGAMVLVTVNDEINIEADVVDGAWSVDVPGPFDTGTHTIDATQTISDMTSGTASMSVTVTAATAPSPETTEPPTKSAPEPTSTSTTAVPAGDSTPVANEDDNDEAAVSNELPKTGSSNVMMSIGAAGGVLLLAGSAFMLFRRRGLEG